MASELTIDDFAQLFGTSSHDLPPVCVDLINKGEWHYDQYPVEERDEIIRDLLRRVEDRDFSIVNENDKSRWITGWGENLSAFEESKGDLDSLLPKYFRPNQPVRLNGDFVKTRDPYFEKHWYEVFREWLFLTQLKGFERIFEFGCGSGFNVARLSEIYPKTKIHGLDWAEPSVEIVENLRTVSGMNVEGHLFDFFNPNYEIEIPENSAVFTIGALEQTGDNNEPFFEYLMKMKPALVIHIEPTYDWYDQGSLVDYLAIRAHEVRNFWRGYHDRLASFQEAGKLEILKTKRAYFGSLVLEGFSQTFWRPI